MEEGSVGDSSSGSCSCKALPCMGGCGRCSIKGITPILYALISFAVTFLVLIIITIDLLVTHRLDGQVLIGALLFLVGLWSPSPGQPMLDKRNKKK